MNYKIVTLVFLLGSFNAALIKAGQTRQIAWCKNSVTLSEAWDKFGPPQNDAPGNIICRDLLKINDAEMIVACSRCKADGKCFIYTETVPQNVEELYFLQNLNVDSRKKLFKIEIWKRFYDPVIQKIVVCNKMFDIRGKLNEPLYFQINNVGYWYNELHRFKSMPKRKVECELTININENV